MITQVKKRNFALDFLKFVFAVLIVLFHSNRFSNSVDERIIINGSKGVEFFFIVSGCMLAMSAEKREAGPSLGMDTWQFLKHKFMGLMPNYYIAWIFSFTLFHIVTGFETVWYDFIRSIPELLLFQMSGMSWYNYNGVTWYLSAMLISMLIIYPLIRKYTDTFFYILAPLGFLFSMGYLMQNYSNLSVILEWNTLVLAGLIRAFSEILLGCVVYKLSKSFQNYSTKINRALFTAAEWFIYGYTIFFISVYKVSKYDFILLFFLAAAVCITVSGVSYDDIIFNHRIFAWLGKYSFSLYLGHTFWRNEKITSVIFGSGWSFRHKLFYYLILSFATGLLIMYLSEFIKHLWTKNRQQKSRLSFQQNEQTISQI